MELPETNEIPINLTAAKQLWKGIEYEVKIPKNHKIWDVKPPLRKINHTMKCDPNFVDLTGKKFGRFTVIGPSKENRSTSIHVINAKDEYYRLERRGNGPMCRWIVRCRCGFYELRNTKIIKKEPQLDRCFLCKSHLHRRKSEYFKLHGKAPTIEQMLKMRW